MREMNECVAMYIGSLLAGIRTQKQTERTIDIKTNVRIIDPFHAPLTPPQPSPP